VFIKLVVHLNLPFLEHMAKFDEIFKHYELRKTFLNAIFKYTILQFMCVVQLFSHLKHLFFIVNACMIYKPINPYPKRY